MSIKKNEWETYFTDYVLKEDIINFNREIENSDMLYDNNLFIMSKEPTSTIYKKLSREQSESYYYQYVNKVTHNKYKNNGWFRYGGKKNKKKSEQMLKKYHKYIRLKRDERKFVKENCEDWDDDILYLRDYRNAVGATLLNIFDDEEFYDDY